MKNSELQETKPIYIHESCYPATDEVSLVDLAMVLVRRKNIIVASIAFFTILGLILAFTIPKSYTFTTSVEIGSQIIGDTVKPFESPQTLLAKVQYSFIPQVLNQERHDHPEDSEKFKVTASMPNNSDIILLKVNGTEDKTVLLSTLLSKITDLAINDHEHIYEAVKQNHKALIKQSQMEIDIIGPENDNLAEKRRFLVSTIEVRKSQLANLRKTREVLPPMKSLEPTNMSKKLMVIIATISGIILGIFFTFIAEFITIVKEKGDKVN